MVTGDEIPDDGDKTVNSGVSSQMLDPCWKTQSHCLLGGSGLEVAGRHACSDMVAMEACSLSEGLYVVFRLLVTKLY